MRSLEICRQMLNFSNQVKAKVNIYSTIKENLLLHCRKFSAFFVVETPLRKNSIRKSINRFLYDTNLYRRVFPNRR